MKMRVQVEANRVAHEVPSWQAGKEFKVIVIEGARGEPIVSALAEARRHVETTLNGAGLR